MLNSGRLSVFPSTILNANCRTVNAPQHFPPAKSVGIVIW